MLYRDIDIRVYGTDKTEKVDKLRKSGINITNLIVDAIMKADINKILEKQNKKTSKI